MSHHEPLGSLGPVQWDDVPQQNLNPFLDDIFTEAQTVIESIPSSALEETTDGSPPSAEGQLDGTSTPTPPSSSVRRQTPAAAEQSQQLRKEWKDCKVSAKDNPLGVSVYKLSSKDGKGAWFARTSVHEGLTFEAWKKGLEKEFGETMKVQEGPGSGNIRGIGADKRVERYVTEDSKSVVQVYQLSAQFPGPTSPRDFTTLLLTCDSHRTIPDDHRPVRQFMIVSKPVEHPECPPRSGIIRGHYESVELIREVPLSLSAAKRTKSAVDLAHAKDTKPPVLKESASDKGRSGPVDAGEVSTTIEWLMVTRSDPGGTVPRFMVEKGTPPGIVGDAGKFLKWLTAQAADDATETEFTDDKVKSAASSEPPVEQRRDQAAADLPAITVQAEREPRQDALPEETSNSGLYGMITGALGAASNAVSGGRQEPVSEKSGVLSTSSSTLPAAEHQLSDDSDSDVSSTDSFASALERSMSKEQDQQGLGEGQPDDMSHSNLLEEKELKRLQAKRQKLDEKAKKMQERIENKRQGGKEKDTAALAKAREKHEKELAKQEAKYKRDLKKLEEKREHEVRKAEQRKRKAAEREEKHNLGLDLASVKNERDIALKKVDLLESQVSELQAQNAKLAARLGKADGLLSASNSGVNLNKDLGKGHNASSSLSSLSSL